MTKDVRREEMSTFAALSACTYNDEICLLALSLSLLFVTQPEVSLRQSSSCLRERSVSAEDYFIVPHGQPFTNIFRCLLILIDLLFVIKILKLKRWLYNF